ncbi:9696_t:CDS:1, partial [Diversispora eburnea]
KIAAISIFEILERQSLIDPTQNEGKDRPTPVTGHSEFRDVYFNYPARPKVKVLRGLNLSIESGKTIALVGPSGSGKSTVISLLLRYYDIRSGKVNLENVNVKNWNLEYLRSNLSFVEQEPILFDVSIRDNIAYGKEICTQEEIETAAKSANIHDFIKNLPQGYDTPVGQRGTQLSGGQKQ